MQVSLLLKYKRFAIGLFFGALFSLRIVQGFASYPDFRTLDYTTYPDEVFYAIKIHYFALTGHLLSPLALSDSIPVILFGTLNRYVSIDLLYIFAPIAFIPILYVVLCRLFDELGHPGISGIGAICVLVLGYYRPLWNDLAGTFGGYYGRFPETMFTAIFFFYALIIIHRRKHLVILGAMVGMMSYMYIYYGIFLIAFILVLRMWRSAMIALIMCAPIIYMSKHAPGWVRDISGVGYPVETSVYIWITILTAIGAICMWKGHGFIGKGILVGTVLEIVMFPVLPQTDHFRIVITQSLAVIALVVLLSRQINQKVVRIALILFLLQVLVVAQLNFYTRYYHQTTLNDSIYNDVNVMLYGNTTLEVYPSILLRNSPDEIITHYNLNQSEINKSYIYVYHYKQRNEGGDK